ncbi:MAG TPA: C1 family peptidase, partial [candidate division Zixibacteria bacterium]
MKCLRLFSLVLLFYLLVMFVGRVSLAQECKECTWTAGKTSVSDLSPEQKAKRLGIKLPPGYWEMWEMLPKFEPTKELSLPTRFDWRDSNVVTPVKDQRDCGSCWDFCAVGALEAMVRKYGEVEMDLSEQQILSCVTYGTGCDGGYPDQAYNHFKSPYGAIYEECMPYQADDEVPCTENSCEKWARISSYTTVSNNVTTIKQALLTYGPVSTLFAAPDTFSYYRGGCFNYAYFDLNHCMLLVGWDDTMCNGQGAWIVKNSWGTGWGVGGYAFIKYGSCMIGTGVEYPNYIYHRPYVRFENLGINDQAGGDGDSRAELGEVVRLDFTLKNLWSPLGNVNVTVSADTSGIMITDNYSYLGTLASGEIKDNSLDPMQFQVPTDFPPRRVYFTFHVEGDSGGGVIYTKDSTLEVLVGHDILLVDDDQGVDLYSNHESYYIAAFDSLKAVYDMWDKKENPDTAYNLSGFNAVIWFTGDHRDSVFSEADIESLKTFLNNSGRLFLTSQDAVEALSGSGNSLYQEFLTDYLHVGYRGNCSRYLVADYPGDEVGDTLWIYPGGVPGASNQTSKDGLVPDM